MSGEYDADGKKLEPHQKYSSFLADAKRYDDMDLLRDDLDLLHENVTRKVFEIKCCSKCKKEFTEHPALSRDDNEMEICPECGVWEAIEAYQKATQE